MLTLVAETTPSVPVAGKGTLYLDSADSRIKMLMADGTTAVLYDLGVSSRNKIINGGFNVNRRLLAALTTIPAGAPGLVVLRRAYTADRWGATTGNVTSLQYAQIDAIAGEAGLAARYYGLYKQITNPAKIALTQVLEGSEITSLRGRAVRMQCKAKYTVLGAGPQYLKMALIQLTAAGTVDVVPGLVTVNDFFGSMSVAGTDPTLVATLAYINPTTAYNGSITGGSYKGAALTNAWQTFGATFTVPTDCKNLAVMIFTDQLLTANDTICVSEVGIYDGMELRDWQRQNGDEEEEYCSRFFAKTFQAATPPAQSAGLLGSLRFPCTTAAAVATSIVGMWQFKYGLRTAPAAVIFYNPSAGNAFARNVTGGTDATATAAANLSQNGCHVNCTGIAAWGVGNDICVHASADVEI